MQAGSEDPKRCRANQMPRRKPKQNCIDRFLGTIPSLPGPWGSNFSSALDQLLRSAWPARPVSMSSRRQGLKTSCNKNKGNPLLHMVLPCTFERKTCPVNRNVVVACIPCTACREADPAAQEIPTSFWRLLVCSWDRFRRWCLGHILLQMHS